MTTASLADTRPPTQPPGTTEARIAYGRVATPTTVAVGAALVAALVVQLATPYGIGVSPDSTQYLSAAQHLLAGDGLRVHWWDHGAQPLTHFPPGYAMVLAALMALGMGAATAARVVNVVALCATAVLAGALGRRAAAGSTPAGVAAGMVVLAAPDVLGVHAMMWSEPAFISLALAAILATVRAIDEDSIAWTVIGAVLAGATGILRYVAPTVIGACCLSLLLLGTRPLARRAARAVLFGAIASLPLLIVLVTNGRNAGAATNRELGFHPVNGEQIRSAVATAFRWVVPVLTSTWLELLLTLAVVASAVALAAAWYRSRGAPAQVGTRSAASAALVLFVACYLGFLALSISFVDAQSTPDQRLLAPVVPAISILLVAMLAAGMRHPERRRASTVLASVLALGLAAALVSWVSRARQDGLGYAHPAWRDSRVIAAVRALPAGAVIYTNHPGAVLYYAGREVLGVPRTADPNSLRRDVTLGQRLALACAATATAPVYYAHFTRAMPDWFLPSFSELQARWRLTTRVSGPEGVLTELAPGC